MRLGRVRVYREAFESLTGEQMVVMRDAFEAYDPLGNLMMAARLTYRQKGVRRASVLKSLRQNDMLKAWGKLHKAELVSGPSVEEFIALVDKELKERGK
jgi:hypothetical protein